MHCTLEWANTLAIDEAGLDRLVAYFTNKLNNDQKAYLNIGKIMVAVWCAIEHIKICASHFDQWIVWWTKTTLLAITSQDQDIKFKSVWVDTVLPLVVWHVARKDNIFADMLFCMLVGKPTWKTLFSVLKELACRDNGSWGRKRGDLAELMSYLCTHTPNT